MNNIFIANSLNFNKYNPFTISSTQTDLVQISGIIPKEDIDKFNKQKSKPTTREIKIKKTKKTTK